MQSTIHLLSRPILGLYPFRNICHSFACLRVNSHSWGYSFVMDHLAECLRNGQTGKRIKFFFFTWYRLEDTVFVVAVSCLRTYLSIWNVFKETERGLDDPVLLIHLFPLFFTARKYPFHIIPCLFFLFCFALEIKSKYFHFLPCLSTYIFSANKKQPNSCFFRNPTAIVNWAGGIRTLVCRSQSPVPLPLGDSPRY